MMNFLIIAITVQEFEDCCKQVQDSGEQVRETMDMKDLLELYALFKQAKVGDCNTGGYGGVKIHSGVVTRQS